MRYWLFSEELTLLIFLYNNSLYVRMFIRFGIFMSVFSRTSKGKKYSQAAQKKQKQEQPIKKGLPP